MRIDEHVTALRREGDLMVAALAQAHAKGELDATVPTCPEWSVRELAQHLGRVHRWAATYVRDARSTMMSAEEDAAAWGDMPDDPALVGWLRHGLERLVNALDTAPANLVCWSFLPALSPLAFWARRQAHETTIHRADLDGVVGSPAPVAADFAVDGIDELLLGFFSRPRNRLRSEGTGTAHPGDDGTGTSRPEEHTSRTIGITASDVDAAWIVHIGPEGARAERGAGVVDCQLRAPASDLYFGLWNRLPPQRLHPTGEVTLLEQWRTKATVRWA